MKFEISNPRRPLCPYRPFRHSPLLIVPSLPKAIEGYSNLLKAKNEKIFLSNLAKTFCVSAFRFPISVFLHVCQPVPANASPRHPVPATPGGGAIPEAFGRLRKPTEAPRGGGLSGHCRRFDFVSRIL
jgi:hypothetical protein